MSARVCLTLIVRDEAERLGACLASAAGLFHDTVVVDTGSTDDTRAVAARCGARVFDFAWRDDFAAARNETLRHARGEWVFWLDADESLDEPNKHRLAELFAALTDEKAAYVLGQRSPAADGAATVVRQVRLFRNLPEVRWQYRVHEQVLPSLRKAGHDVRFTDLLVQHAGYLDAALTERKLRRNLRLLQLDYMQQPSDAFTLFNLGWAHVPLRRFHEAVVFLRRSLELSQPGDSIVRKAYALLADCQRHLGRPELALEACRAGRACCPDDVELAYLEGALLAQRGEVAAAEACWRGLLPEAGRAVGAPPAFASYDEGLHGYRVRQRLAELCHAQGRAADAEEHWRAALAERADFRPAWRGLAELYLLQQRWAELDGVLAAVCPEPSWQLDAALLRGRALLARREFAAARRLIEQARAQHPQALGPRILLTHALLQEGADEAAAEQALREVLACDPRQAESWRNLAVLLRQQGRAAEAAAACQAGRRQLPDDVGLLRLHAALLQESGDSATAGKMHRRAEVLAGMAHG